MTYRLADETDIVSISNIISSAITEMERNDIFQWDAIYPAKDDFLSDIRKNTLFVGTNDSDICVVFAISKECDEQYQNGKWEYPDSDYRVIHRLCVNPIYQNRGIARETLLFIEDELRRQGIATIRLDVFSNNPFALSLYRNNGYKEVGIADWRKGRFLLMEKAL